MTQAEPVRKAFFTLIILGMAGFAVALSVHMMAAGLVAHFCEIPVVPGVCPGALALSGQVSSVISLGLMIVIYDLAAAIGKGPLGTLADRKGRKLVLLSGLTIFSTIPLLYTLLPIDETPLAVMLVRFLQGLGAATISPISMALISEAYSDSKGKALGLYHASKGAGYIIGPVIGVIVATQLGFEMLFQLSFFMGALALLLCVFLPSDKCWKNSNEKNHKPVFKDMLRRREFMVSVFVIFSCMFFSGVRIGYLYPYAGKLGFPPLLIGSIMTLGAVSCVFAQTFVGELSDYIGRKQVILLGFASCAISFTWLSWAKSLPALLVIVSVLTFGISTIWTASNAYLADKAPQEELGTYMGFGGSFQGMGEIAGITVTGLAFLTIGFTWGFTICAILSLLGIASVFFLQE